MSARVVASLNRRDFLYCAGAVAGLAALGGVAVASGKEPLVRPPGGQDEDTFLSLCTRCDRCRSACPTQAIAPAVLEDGLIAVRTPKLNFKLGWCDFCGRCVEVCPTGALAMNCGDAFEAPGIGHAVFRTTDAVLGTAVVNQERCIIWRGQSECIACSQACPYEAISLDGSGRPVVEEDRCNGCGVCEYVCPSSRLLSFEGGTERGIGVVAPAAVTAM